MHSFSSTGRITTYTNHIVYSVTVRTIRNTTSNGVQLKIYCTHPTSARSIQRERGPDRKNLLVHTFTTIFSLSLSLFLCLLLNSKSVCPDIVWQEYDTFFDCVSLQDTSRGGLLSSLTFVTMRTATTKVATLTVTPLLPDVVPTYTVLYKPIKETINL